MRESRESLLIELPQLLTYKLTTAETITASVPSACLVSGNELQAQHIDGVPFRVLPARGRAYVTGSFLQQALEGVLQTTASQLIVNLYDDTFYGTAESFHTMIYGSLGSQPGGWESVVQSSLVATITPHTTGRGIDVTVDIPKSPGYAISEPETISVLISASLLASEQPILASPSFVIEVAGWVQRDLSLPLVAGVCGIRLACVGSGSRVWDLVACG